MVPGSLNWLVSQGTSYGPREPKGPLGSSVMSKHGLRLQAEVCGGCFALSHAQEACGVLPLIETVHTHTAYSWTLPTSVAHLNIASNI